MKSIKIIIAAVLVMAGVSVMGQWNANGSHIYNSNSGFVGIGSGTSFTPMENLHIYTPAAAANIALESNFAPTSGNNVIGRYRIRNKNNGDLYYIGLRNWNGEREAIQSVKNGITGQWLEFLYINIGTQKYELRSGILDAEFKNSGNTTFSNNGNILFNNTGSISIGTTPAPTGYKLSVDGKIICTELKVELSSEWPDYVFSNDYFLTPLKDVEAFIKENGHLPGIPTAKEMSKDGLSVGEMNVKLMEKIEELTLYVIELQKEIDSLK